MGEYAGRPNHLVLMELIRLLEGEDPALTLPLGFAHPHSYRGYYSELAFEPAVNVTIGAMLADAKGALGKTFTGYKGGDYVMGEWTECWLANYGDTGETLGVTLLRFMVAQGKAAAGV